MVLIQTKYKRIPHEEIFGVEEGIPETLGEIYFTSVHENARVKEAFLHIFNVEEMERIHRIHHQRYEESFRFIGSGPRQICGEVDERLRARDISLQFSEYRRGYRALLGVNVSLIEVFEVLRDLERKYS